MKAIMLSVKPKWLAKILNGEKTIEIRKTMPKCDLPIDVYIYATKEERLEYRYDVYDNFGEYFSHKGKTWEDEDLSGKVIAKFTLNKVEEIYIKYEKGWVMGEKEINAIEKETCLRRFQLFDYLKSKTGYAWYIDDLEIFDKPKELSEFFKFGVNEYVNKNAGTDIGYLEFWNTVEGYRLTKAPQSWCYVEEEKNGK